MLIIGYIFLGVYHAFIVVPLFFIIPQSLITTLYLFYEKKWNKKYIKHFFITSSLTFVVASIITHVYMIVRSLILLLSPIPVLFNIFSIIQMSIYLAIPFLPLVISYYVNRHLYSKKQRKLYYFSTAYFFYALLIIIFFIRYSHGVQLPQEYFTKPLLLPNMVNFTEIFDVLESSLFH